MAILASAVMILTACTGGTDGGGGGTGDGGDSITIGLAEEPRTLASWNAYSNDGHPILRNVGEGLLNRDPETSELVPELATAWEQVDDTTWRFTLREGVKFHDGTDFNAEAAADALNYVLDKENAFAMRTFLGPEVTFTATDEYALDATTELPDPILPTRLYFVTIPSPTQIQDDPEAYETHPIGTGPYQFVDWTRGQSIELEANPDWWGLTDTEDAHGTQSIKSVKYVFRPETAVRAAMVEQNEANLVNRITTEECEVSPKCESTPTVEMVVLRLDTPNPMIGDLRIRQAISMAFDKDVVMNDLGGGGDTFGQIVGPAAVGYADLDPYPYDPEKAKELVEEAAADGVDVTAPLQVNAREGYILRANEQIQYIADQLKAIGLTGATSGMYETAAFEEQWTIGYDNIPPERGLLGLQQHGNELMDFAQSVAGYYSCGGATSAYCDPTLEKMYEAALPTSGDERDEKFQEIAKYLYDQVPVVPIGAPSFNFGLSENLDWTPRMDGFILLKEMTLS
ncbi:ABC transporter substrate-binding protein [Microbacterium sp. Bi121]|uniref:ABC transporter substrate-binding protein n=1 Tax=Microbacterium sp. Bi121 TaxID=2822348 RepID=UPI001E380512|nr:ABC transporter substrate-binding protein [Microbacterium sp. Bi121]